MRPGNLLVLLLATITIGAAAWFLLREDQTSATAPVGSQDLSDPADDAELHTADAGEFDPTAAPEHGERSEVVAANASATLEENPGAVAGRVTDANGVPVAGARVFVTTSKVFIQRSTLIDPTATPKKLADSPVGETNSDGRFEVAAPTSSDPLRLAVISALHTAKLVDAPATAGSVVDVGEVRVDLGIMVRGRVVDMPGRPIADASVTVRRIGSFEAFWNRNADNGARTDAAGHFRLLLDAPGEVELVAAHADYADGSVALAPTQRGERIDGVTIGLGTGASIVGRVTGSPAAAKLQVRASPVKSKVGDKAEHNFIMFAITDRPAFARHVTDVESGGLFELRGLLAGERYRVFVVRESREEHPVAVPLELDSGARGVEIAYGTGLNATFRAIDAQSRDACAEVAATVNVRGPKSAASLNIFYAPPDRRELVADADGQFLIESIPANEPDQQLTLTLRAAGYRPHKLTDVALPNQGTIDLGTLELEPAPIVHVVVRTADGTPVEDADVGTRVPRASRSDEAGRLAMPSANTAEAKWSNGNASAKTNAAGECDLTIERAEKIRVTVDHKEFAPYESATIELPAKERVDHAVTVRVGGTLVVHVIDTNGDAVPAVDVHSTRVADATTQAQAQRKNSRANAMGDAIFTRLAAGEYRINLGSARGALQHWLGDEGGEADADQSTTLVIEDAQSHELTLTRELRASVTGVVTLNGLPIEGARVSVGKAKDLSSYAMHGDHGPGAKTDSAGRYELTDLELGELTISAYHANRAMANEHTVQVAEGGSVFDIALSTASVRGRVIDQNGKPVEGATVTATRVTTSGDENLHGQIMLWGTSGGFVATGSKAAPGSATTNANGEYRLEGVEADRPIQVAVKSDRHGPAKSDPFRVASANATHSGVDFTLTGAGSLKVLVAEDTGFARISAKYADPTTDPVEDKSAFASGGVAKLASLRPGKWTISRMGSRDSKRTVEVIEGETVTVDLRQ